MTWRCARALAGGLRARLRLVLLAGAAVGVVGCNPGAYPIDIFPEMHYQVMQRRLEPDRLSAPRDAVPVTGGQPRFTFAEARDNTNPLQATPDQLQRAASVYATNCAMCHGRDGRGQSVVAQHFERAKVVPPVDLASDRVRNRTDGELHWLITNGIGGMPPFENLLTEDDRWALVLFVRQVQGR